MHTVVTMKPSMGAIALQLLQFAKHLDQAYSCLEFAGDEESFLKASISDVSEVLTSMNGILSGTLSDVTMAESKKGTLYSNLLMRHLFTMGAAKAVFRGGIQGGDMMVAVSNRAAIKDEYGASGVVSKLELIRDNCNLSVSVKKVLSEAIEILKVTLPDDAAQPYGYFRKVEDQVLPSNPGLPGSFPLFARTTNKTAMPNVWWCPTCRMATVHSLRGHDLCCDECEGITATWHAEVRVDTVVQQGKLSQTAIKGDELLGTTPKE